MERTREKHQRKSTASDTLRAQINKIAEEQAATGPQQLAKAKLEKIRELLENEKKKDKRPPYAGPPYAGPPYAGPPYAGPP